MSLEEDVHEIKEALLRAETDKRRDDWRNLIITGLGIVFALLGLFYTADDPVSKSLFIVITMLFGATFFGFLMGGFIGRLLGIGKKG